MKEAMWNADPGGAFQFSDATNPDQIVFFTDEPNFMELRQMLLERFDNQVVEMKEVKDFVDLETPFLSSRHLKRGTLIPMEDEGLIEVVESPRKRGYGFPDGTIVKFLGAEAE